MLLRTLIIGIVMVGFVHIDSLGSFQKSCSIRSHPDCILNVSKPCAQCLVEERQVAEVLAHQQGVMDTAQGTLR